MKLKFLLALALLMLFCGCSLLSQNGEDGSACDVCEQMRRRKLAKYGTAKPLRETVKD